MKMYRRITSVVLALSIGLTFCPFTAWAAVGHDFSHFPYYASFEGENNKSFNKAFTTAGQYDWRSEGAGGQEVTVGGVTTINPIYGSVTFSTDARADLPGTLGSTGVKMERTTSAISHIYFQRNQDSVANKGTLAQGGTPTFDYSKNYIISFKARKEGSALTEFRLINSAQYDGTTNWDPQYTIKITSESWQYYELQLGPNTVNNHKTKIENKRFIERFVVENSSGALYIDEYSIREFDPFDIVSEGHFDFPAEEGAAFVSGKSLWKVNSGTVTFSSAAGYNSNYGVVLDGSGSAKFAYSAEGFKTSAKYAVKFYGKPQGGSYEVDILNSGGSSILERPIAIEDESYYRVIIGPKGSSGVNIGYEPDLVTAGKVVIQFRQIGAAGKLFLDSVACVETSDEKLKFKLNSLNIAYKGNTESPFTGLLGGEILAVDLDLANGSTSEKSMEVIAALYDTSGMLTEYRSSGAVKIAADTSTYVVNLEYTLPVNVAGKKLRIFFWDDAEKQAILLPAADLPGSYTLAAMLSQATGITKRVSFGHTPLVENKVVKITGVSPNGAGKRVSLLVKKNSDSSKLYFDEKISGAGGEARFEFLLDDSALLNDCTVYLGGEDALNSEQTFFYYSNRELEDVVQLVNTTSFESVIANAVNRKVLLGNGLDFVLFDRISSEGKTAVNQSVDTGKPTGGYGSVALTNAFNDISVTRFFNEKRLLNLSLFKSEFEDYAKVHFTEYLQNDWVYEKIKSADQQSLSGIQSRLNELSALYSANNAGYVVLPQVLAKHENVLQMNLCNNYSTYKALADGSALKDAVSKEYLKLADSNVPDESSKLRTYFDTAYNTAKAAYDASINQGSGQKGGGGGGGGGAPSSVSSMAVIDNQKEVMDNSKPAYTAKFADLEGYEWARESIEELYFKGIVSGVSETAFLPQNNVSREELVKLLVVAVGIELVESETDFDDVDAEAWYAPYVVSAKNAGIVNGITPYSFGVGSAITRQDIAVMMYRMLTMLGKAPDIHNVMTFDDKEQVSEYAIDGVAAMNECGIMTGYPDNTFAPANAVTRAESAVIIYRLYRFCEAQ